MKNTVIRFPPPELKVLKRSGLIENATDEEVKDLLGLARTKTLYADDGTAISIDCISIKTWLALLADNQDITFADVERCVEGTIESMRKELKPCTCEGIDCYDWTLLWMICADLVSKFKNLLNGTGECWHFDDQPVTNKLFSASQNHTIDLMDKEFKASTNHTNPLGVLVKSFLGGESGDQVQARLNGNGLKSVTGQDAL